MPNYINKAAWQDALLKEEILEEIAGGGVPVEVAWDDVTDKPSTFPPVIGTTASTAKAGNYTPAWSEISDVPAALTAAQAAGTASIRALGTTATTAAAGNHTHTGTQVTLTGYVIGTVAEAPVAAADTVNAAIAKLEKRIADLEAAAAA